MNVSALPFKPSENETIILKLWGDYQEVINPKYLNCKIEGFQVNVEQALTEWIYVTGEPRIEYLKPMLFDFLLNGDISHDSIRASVALKRKWKKLENVDLKISRGYSKKQGLNHSRNTFIKHLYQTSNDGKNIEHLRKQREIILLEKGQDINNLNHSKNYQYAILAIMKLLGFQCTKDNINDALFRDSATNYSFYDCD
jgi:hypothetical protein